MDENGIQCTQIDQYSTMYTRLKLETRPWKSASKHDFSFSQQKKNPKFKKKRLYDYCYIFRAIPIFTVECTYDRTENVLSYVHPIVNMGFARKMLQKSQRRFLLNIRVFFYSEKENLCLHAYFESLVSSFNLMCITPFVQNRKS